MIYGNRLSTINESLIKKPVNYFNYNEAKRVLDDAVISDNSDKEVKKVLIEMIRTNVYSARLGIKMIDLYKDNYNYNNDMSRLVHDYIGFLNTNEQIEAVYNAAKSAFIPKSVKIKFIPVGIPSIDQMETVLKSGGYLGKKLNIDEFSYSYYNNLYKKLAMDLSKIMIICKKAEE